MNNKTKIRLHLSKNLFESLTREILTEAKKANDGYTVAVKQPKMPKQSKSQATSPEVQKTDAEATMGEMETKVAEENVNEISSEMDLLQQAAPILGTILGVGGTFLASYIKALKSAKTPEEKERLNQALRNQISKSKGH